MANCVARLLIHLPLLAGGRLSRRITTVQRGTFNCLGQRTLRRCHGVHGTRGGNTEVATGSRSTVACLCLVTLDNRRIPTSGRTTCHCFLSGMNTGLGSKAVDDGTRSTVVLGTMKHATRTGRFVTSLGRRLMRASRLNTCFTFRTGPCG